MFGQTPLSHLQVIGVRYRGCHPVGPGRCPLAHYEASGVFTRAGVPHEIVLPVMPESIDDDEHDTVRTGRLDGVIADETARALVSGSRVLMVGGSCSHITGVIGGLQDVAGSDARIGLIWFDAHGDFNTPRTSPSGMLGGMPVAVAAGLAWPRWRELSHIAAPMPTNRILMVDVRNLDPDEAALIRATDIHITRVQDRDRFAHDVRALADECDILYLHVDSDILDASLVPNHPTREPNGPSLDEVNAAIRIAMSTGKVATFAVVSVDAAGEDGAVSVRHATAMIDAGLEAWRDGSRTD